MRLILLGAPGSGKGTQAKILSEYYKAKRISLGDILRQEVKKNTDLGKRIREYIEKGILVPDHIVSLVIEENIDREGFIIDGYPRNILQAKDLDKILNKKGSRVDAAIYLDVDESTVIKRLSGRRVCRGCGANFHIENMPSKKPGICDLCGAELIQREDDKPRLIKKRWQIFERESSPLINYYKEKEKLIVVDANRGAKEVFQDIVKSL
jgi:adenylate kinase